LRTGASPYSLYHLSDLVAHRRLAVLSGEVTVLEGVGGLVHVHGFRVVGGVDRGILIDRERSAIRRDATVRIRV
jgi:hypothetical protein